MLIGITGHIGSGKTEVAKIFKKKGAFVISADKIGKDVVEKNQTILNKLVRTFGESILTPSGRLRRRKLGEMALVSEENKNKLNKIVHPQLLKEMNFQTKRALKNYDMVVIDAALLIDWAWDKKVDITILVHSGDKIIIARLLENGYSIKEARIIIKSQMKYDALRKRADIVIFNNKSIYTLGEKAAIIFDKLTQKGLT
jgi:dephospho-CoA kinase